MFDLKALTAATEEYAKLKLTDREEFAARMDAHKSDAISAGCKESFAEWRKKVNRLAATLEHRAKIEASGVRIDSASDTDLAMVLIGKLTEGSTRPAVHGVDVVRYSGDGLYGKIGQHDLRCMVQALEGEPYFDDMGKPQYLKVSNKRTKDVSEAAISKICGSADAGGLGRGGAWFSSAPKGIMFTNCFLTVEGSRLISKNISPTHRATHRHEFAFDPDRKAPRFLKYINDMLKPDQLQAMQELLGAAMFGLGPRYQRAGFIKGEPGTGKGTLIKIIKGIMPPNTTGTSEPGSWNDPQFAATLHGVLLNGVEELRNAHFGDVNTLKSVITGDEMSAKIVYRPVLVFRPIATHIIASNQWPSTSNSDRAFWDRWLVFLLEGKRYRGTDEQIPDFHNVLLREELPGIVTWVVEGMARLAEQGRYTEIPDGAAHEWRGESNNIAVFARECLTQVGDVATPPATAKRLVYERYRGWCHECGYQPLGRNKFYTAVLREDEIRQTGRTGTLLNVSIIGTAPRSWGNGG